MRGFINVITNDGRDVLLNIDSIKYVSDIESSLSRIELSDGEYIAVQETITGIRRLIQIAQK